MTKAIHRRSFLKATGALGAGIGLAGFAGSGLAADTAKGAPNAEKLGWKLACAAYSFNRLTFFETVDKIASLGLDTVEGFDWQKLSPEKPGVQTG
ncbi:MAG: twin-arginine translocation signal domain-containing protein, partial [Planctomycetota bacterium]